MPRDEEDTIDEQARRLTRMLLGNDTTDDPLRPERHKLHNATKSRWSTMGNVSPLVEPDEPEHPVLVACAAWRRALLRHDSASALVAAQRLKTLLQGYDGRPTIAAALSFFHAHQPDAAENVQYIDSVAAFVRQSQ